MTLSDPSITYNELRWLLLALLLCACIATVRFWTKDSGRKLDGSGGAPADRHGWHEAVQAMQARSDLDARVRALEQSLEHVPSSTDFAELAGEVNTVKFQFISQADELKAMRATLYRIEDFLLKGKRT